MLNLKSFWISILQYAIFLIFFLQCFSKSALALSFTISGAPETIAPDQEFGISIDYQSDAGEVDYYLQVAFTSPGESKYFGKTQDNNGNWHIYGESYENYYKITTSGGDWSGTIKGRVDTEDPDYKGEGNYILKVKRFSTTGASYIWSNELTINIQSLSSPSLSPSPSPSPSSSTATYKINEVKDEDGNTLSSVKVYVDGVYLHHYAPETLTFCDTCQCDTYVACSFGEHIIKLEKSGYEDWSETKTMNSGDNFEVNPVMSLSDSSSSSSSSPSPSPSPSLNLTASSKPSVQTQARKQEESYEATFTGEILGATQSGEQKEKEKETEKSETGFLTKLPFLLIPGGIILLFIANFQTLKPKIQDVIELIKYKFGH